MVIRAVAPGDLDTLIELFAEHAAYERLEFAGHDRRPALAELMFGETPRIFGWVLDAGGGVAGYMTATIDHSTWNAAPFVYMDCLYLREAYRSRGLGRRLMNELTTFARAHGCREIQWHTPPDNMLGIRFYRRIGATEKAKVRFFLDAGPVAVESRAC